MNNFTNKITWLLHEELINNEDLNIGYITCDTAKELLNLVLNNYNKMEYGEEILDCVKEINWNELLNVR